MPALVFTAAFCDTKYVLGPLGYHAEGISGIVDSLKVLIMHGNFIKPYPEQHVLASFLTRAF